jgi:putative salt-induced outer membrane protein YdiY
VPQFAAKAQMAVTKTTKTTMTKTTTLAIAFAAMAVVAPSQAQSLKSENSKLRAENEALRSEVNKLKKVAPKNVWVRQLSAGLVLTSGNNDTLTVTGGLSIEKETDNDKFRAFLNGAYGETNSTKNTEFLRSGLNYQADFSKFAYWYAGLGIEHDDVAGLDFRLSVGPGVGFHLVKTEALELNVEAGLAFYHEKYNVPVASNEDTLRARFGESFTYKFAQGAKFYQTAELAGDVSDTDNYIVNLEAGVESTLTENLKLRLSFLDRYVAEPPLGLDKNDIQVTSSIVIGF